MSSRTFNTGLADGFEWFSDRFSDLPGGMRFSTAHVVAATSR